MEDLMKRYSKSREKSLEILDSIASRFGVTRERVLEVLREEDCLKLFYDHTDIESRFSLFPSYDCCWEGIYLENNPYRGRLFNLYINLDKINGKSVIKGFCDLFKNPYSRWKEVIFNDNYSPIETTGDIPIEIPEFFTSHPIDERIKLFKKLSLSEVWVTDRYLILATDNFDVYFPIWEIPVRFSIPCYGKGLEILKEDIANLISIGYHKGLIYLQGQHRHIFGYPSKIEGLPSHYPDTYFLELTGDIPEEIEYQGDILYPEISNKLYSLMDKISNEWKLGFTSDFDMMLVSQDIAFNIPYQFDLCRRPYDGHSDLHRYLVIKELEEDPEEDDWWE
ncbi:MAG: hypothetical protein ACK4NC_07340 [Candidatus Gracilibacteria bacterium]